MRIRLQQGCILADRVGTCLILASAWGVALTQWGQKLEETLIKTILSIVLYVTNLAKLEKRTDSKYLYKKVKRGQNRRTPRGMRNSEPCMEAVYRYPFASTTSPQVYTTYAKYKRCPFIVLIIYLSACLSTSLLHKEQKKTKLVQCSSDQNLKLH